MVIQAYFEDSSGDKGFYAIAGYIARAEDWAKFSKDWEQLLPLTMVGNSGRHRFKMREMSHRTEDLKKFYNVITEHVAFSASISISEKDVRAAKSRVWSDNSELLWTSKQEPKHLIASLFLKTFYECAWSHERIREWLFPEDRIDIYFDNDLTSEWVLDEWGEVLSKSDEHIQGIAGSSPKFEDDEELLPLQAADFLAWCVRKGREDGNVTDVLKGNFGDWVGKTIPGLHITLGEDELTQNFINGFKAGNPIPGLINVYDSKIKPRNGTEMRQICASKRSNFIGFFERKLAFLRRR